MLEFIVKPSWILMRLYPRERRVKSQIGAKIEAAYITKNGALKSAYKGASNVEETLLVAGWSQWESAQLFKVGHSL